MGSCITNMHKIKKLIYLQLDGQLKPSPQPHNQNLYNYPYFKNHCLCICC